MNSFFDGLARFVVRYRWLVLVFWVLLAVVASKTLPSMGSEVNNDNSAFLPASAPSQKAAALLVPVQGDVTNRSQILVVASRTGSPLTLTDQAAVAKLAVAVDDVDRVASAKQVGISSDGEATEILVEATVNASDIADQKTVIDDVAATFAEIRAPAGLEFHLTGSTADTVANSASSDKTTNRLQLFSPIFIIVLLLLIFRSLLAPLLTLLPSVFALVVSMRFIGGLGAHGVKISEVTTLLLIILLLGAGTDYGLFLVFRVREEIRRGLEPREAVATALVRVGESITASAGTVILALLTLLFASFGIYNNLGLPLAVGVAVMLFAGLTLLPALLAIFGRAAFWPSKVVKGPAKQGLWGTIAARLVRRPAITLGVGLVVFIGLAAAVFGYHSGGFGGQINAPDGSDAAVGDAVVAAHFPHLTTDPANIAFKFPEPIWANPTEVVDAETSLQASGDFSRLAGPLSANGAVLTPAQLTMLHSTLGSPQLLPAVEPARSTVPLSQYEAYRASAPFVSSDGRIIQFQAAFAAGGQQSTAALLAVPEVRTAVNHAALASGALASGLAGLAANFYDTSAASNHDVVHVFPIAIFAIGFLLALVLRSMVAPLYLIVSVALSFLAALGVSTLLFIDIGHDGGLTFILPFLMFVFLLALGEDYNILVMTRIREEAHSLPLREAVAKAVGMTGPTVTSAGLILAGTFGVLTLSGGGSEVTAIGAGLAIGILMDTFLVRTLLVPSTVVLLGRWNWWPSPMSRPEWRPTAVSDVLDRADGAGAVGVGMGSADVAVPAGGPDVAVEPA